MIPCAGLSNDVYVEVSEKEIEHGESFAVGDVTKWDFILLKLAVKRNVPYYMVALMNDFNGCECEIAIYYIWRIPINLSLTKKNEYFSNLCSGILWKLPPPLPAGMSNAKHDSCVF